MHPPHVRTSILELVDQGLNDCAIARRVAIPRTTVRDFRLYRDRTRGRNSGSARVLETCPRCWRAARLMRFAREDYAELLGLYLGDGSISRHPRTDRLRIVLDAKYPGIIEATRVLLQRCFKANAVHVGMGSKGKCCSVSVYSTHLACLFPQHGSGPKHLRSIALEPWQQETVEAAPWAFLRGCVRSDGSAFINRTGPYEYLSYDFGNRSADIARLFGGVCEQLGLRPRMNVDPRGLWRIRINRRESVAQMVEQVGLKS
jgi:hypothetical protein